LLIRYILALGLCCASLVDKVTSSVIALIALCLAHTVFVGFNLARAHARFS
jgi:hypothetical protein